MYTSCFDENQKKLFLELAIHAALSNNNFDITERMVIDEYCKEMAITATTYEANMNLEEVLARAC